MKTSAPFLAAALCLFLPLAAAAQKKAASRASQAPAKAIRFDGAPQYSQQELLTAAGLTPQSAFDAATLKARAKQLSDTGYFDAIKLKFDSKTVLFTLAPTTQLYPLRIDNLPLVPGKELDSQLRGRYPLYRGQLPASGTVVEGIRATIEQQLAAQGLKVAVKATLTSGLGPQKITAMNFAIAAPPVKIGVLQLTGVSAPMQAKAITLASGQRGNDYDTTNTAPGLKHAFEDLYQEQGYAAVQVEVTQSTPQLTVQALEVPFAIKITDGGLYKLGAIAYPADALVPRAEVEKVRAKYQTGSGRPLDLFVLAVRDAHHARGYLDCATETHIAFNEATRIVNYSLDVTAGPVYQFAAVTFEGAPAPMLPRLAKAWKLTAGAAFDESFVSNFSALAQKQDKQLAKWMQSMLVTFDINSDPSAHTVTVLFHFAKAVQTTK